MGQQSSYSHSIASAAPGGGLLNDGGASAALEGGLLNDGVGGAAPGGAVK